MRIRKTNLNGLGRPGSLLAVWTAVNQFTGALGLTLSLCSSQNTGSGNTPDSTIYQSLGACQNQCIASYAFAVVQGENCWCSNYAPASTVNISQCNTNCPGYPYEQCGSTPNNLFGYLVLNIAPSGTINAQSSAALSTTPSLVATSQVSSPLASTGFSSLTGPVQTSRVTSSITTVETIDVTVTAEESGSTVTSVSSTVVTPYTTQSLATIGGTVVTSFVTVTPTATSIADSGVTKSKMSSGSIIAIAVASVVAAVVLLAALIIGFCCWRRKVQRSYTPDVPEVFPKRTTSVLSKSGLLGTPATSNNSNPGEIPAILERRSSRPMVYDQRLNPNAIMQHDDGSRSSFVSMQDNRDYTRALKVRNPDPADQTQ